MGLFTKKYCDICGEKIGLLGNRKLKDGNLCKECAAKLSPWFDERRSSTVDEIREQLEYREENKKAAASFHTTKTYGNNVKVLLDEDAGKFVVTSARDLAEANPDVLDYSQVTGCELKVEENEREDKREVKDKDGHTNRVSYVPPRYFYSYDFYVDIRVNTPYFDNMRFRLNSSDVEVGGARREAPDRAACMADHDYRQYYNMGEEIKKALTKVRQEVRDDILAAKAPKVKVVCPSCGATTTPDASGCCEYCGAAIG